MRTKNNSELRTPNSEIKINVYDFDKTIYDGDSTKDFFLFCLKRYPSVSRILPRFAFYAFLYIIGNCGKEKMKEAFFRFLRVLPDTESEVELFWNYSFNKIWGWYLDQKQDSDVIISASPEFLLKPVCSKLNISLIASLNDPKSGQFTGLNCYGEEKPKRFREIYPNAEIECFYSDSESDKPMALLAKSAYLVKRDVISKWSL